MFHILVIEDDEDLAASIMDYLEMESIRCDYARTGEEGLRLASSPAGSYDAAVLDICLPGMDGLAVCSGLRAGGVDTPVLMLTARDRLEDKLAGFGAGTDDYLVKPFAMQELAARIRALAMRRSGQAGVLRCADLSMDLNARTAERQGKPLSLRPVEWKLLHALLRHSPGVVSRERLLLEVWGDDPPNSDSLKVHLSRLRKAVDGPFGDPLIHTLPGQGVALRKLVQKAHAGGESFFVALIDYRMGGGMNGVSTAVKLRELLGENVPIILISAYDWDDIEEDAGKAGIEGFIPKSLFKSTLYRALKRFSGEGAGVPDAKAPASEKTSLEGLRVLLAEDQPLNAEIAATILEEAGASVDHAEDGAVASRMFQESGEGWYDVVLMDLRMPNMDGIAATKAIRAMERSDAGTVPIIALTADAFAEDAQRCLDAGMNTHMAKPIDVKMLVRKLAELRRQRPDESGEA